MSRKGHWKFPGRLKKYGVTKEIYLDELSRRRKWCSFHKCFEPFESFRNPETSRQRCIEGTKRTPDQIHLDVCRHHEVTPEWYARKLEGQKGVCALCGSNEQFNHFRTGKPPRLAIDHDHDTKKARGLLCLSCNRQLGYAEIVLKMADIIIALPGTWLEKAIAYLEQYKES